MQLYDSLSGEKKNLPETHGNSLRLFVCGPTVYGLIHIGNARTFTVFDTLVRFLRARGTNVFYLQNITDIDDKVLRRAQEEHKDWKDVARMYERAFHKDEKDLHIASVTKYAPATRYIKEIVRQVQTLIQKGHAYEIVSDPSTGRAGGWYFDVTTFPDYGKLARRTVTQAEDGVSRIDESVNKRNRADFVLWKYPETQIHADRDADSRRLSKEPSWKSPLGAGRPGWHIEDTAITEHFLGPQYDIHGAGIDLKFPHHEAEIAQEESASGKKPMVHIWMHAAFVDMADTKMSKSVGNVITARAFLNQHPGNLFRFIVASHHYRTRIKWNDALVTQAEQTLGGLIEFFAKLELARKRRPQQFLDSRLASFAEVATKAERGNDTRTEMAKAEKLFQTAMKDDLNTPKALAAIFELINAVNPIIWTLEKKEVKAILTFMESHLAILGIILKPLKIPNEIKQKVRERELFRTSQQFVQSDRLRDELGALGWRVEDTPLGPLILKEYS